MNQPKARTPEHLVGKVYKSKPEFSRMLIKLLEEADIPTASNYMEFIPALVWRTGKSQPDFGTYYIEQIQAYFDEVDESEWLTAILQSGL